MTVDVGHLEVGDDGVEGFAGEGIDGIRTGLKGHHLMSVADEELRQAAHCRDIVVDHQKSRHGFRYHANPVPEYRPYNRWVLCERAPQLLRLPR